MKPGDLRTPKAWSPLASARVHAYSLATRAVIFCWCVNVPARKPARLLALESLPVTSRFGWRGTKWATLRNDAILVQLLRDRILEGGRIGANIY